MTAGGGAGLEEQKGKKIHLNEYMKILLENRKKEVIKEDHINELNRKKGEGLTSPTTETTTEETRLFTDYMHRANIFHIAKSDEKRGKILMLRKFFKSKRNDEVEVYSKCGKECIHTVGKVSTIGRDFVMLTNLNKRIWIPYSVVESANIPHGIPTYSNTHQHLFYDNNLRDKLLYNFGETVAKRDVLKQQFFEETLNTNLHVWKETWVEIHLNEKEKIVGKIASSIKNKCTLNYFGKKVEVDLANVQYITTIRFLSLLPNIGKYFAKGDKNDEK